MELERCTIHTTMQYNPSHYCPQCINEGRIHPEQIPLFEQKDKLTDFMDEFVPALIAHLKGKESHWGNTWLKRSRATLRTRLSAHLMDKCERSLNGDIPIDWLSVVGDAMIGWIRENHPEIGND